MGLAEQQDQLGAIARRFVEVAPAGWVRLLGRWEAAAEPSGAARLDATTAAVVDGGDRWLFGRLDLDPVLHGAVVGLRVLVEEDSGRPWTTLELLLDPDGTVQVDLGYDPPEGSGPRDEQSVGGLRRHFDTWVAERGPVPSRAVPPIGSPAVVALTPAQVDLVGQIARSYARDAPTGWLRIVSRVECSVAQLTAGSVAVRVVVVQTPDGLVQRHFRAPRDLHFEAGDLLRALAAESPTQVVVLSLVIDRDGSHEATLTQDVPRVLDGIRDETSSGAVHDYLELHRDELERLRR